MWQQFLSGDLVEQYWKMSPCCTQPWKANYLSYFVTTDESYWKTMHVGGAPPGGGGGGNDLAVRIKSCFALPTLLPRSKIRIELHMHYAMHKDRPTNMHYMSSFWNPIFWNAVQCRFEQKLLFSAYVFVGIPSYCHCDATNNVSLLQPLCHCLLPNTNDCVQNKTDFTDLG